MPENPVDKLLRVDVLSGIVVGLIALAILAQSWNLPMGEIRYFGPGFLPKVLGTTLLAGAAVLLVWGWVQPEDHAERVHMAWRGPAMVAAGVVFFALFIRSWNVGPVPTPQLGLLLVAPITVVLTGLGSREADVKELIVLGFGLTGLATILFSDLLGLQIPLFPRVLESAILDTFGYEWPKRVAYLVWLAICYGLFRYFGLSFTGPATQTGDEQ